MSDRYSKVIRILKIRFLFIGSLIENDIFKYNIRFFEVVDENFKTDKILNYIYLLELKFKFQNYMSISG